MLWNTKFYYCVQIYATGDYPEQVGSSGHPRNPFLEDTNILK
jgi:hypothetical protein